MRGRARVPSKIRAAFEPRPGPHMNCKSPPANTMPTLFESISAELAAHPRYFGGEGDPDHRERALGCAAHLTLVACGLKRAMGFDRPARRSLSPEDFDFACRLGDAAGCDVWWWRPGNSPYCLTAAARGQATTIIAELEAAMALPRGSGSRDRALGRAFGYLDPDPARGPTRLARWTVQGDLDRGPAFAGAAEAFGEFVGDDVGEAALEARRAAFSAAVAPALISLGLD